MQYVLLFLEGIITFISPCLLPMLPIYVSYFAGGSEEKTTKKTLVNSLGFVLGFTVIFVTLGAFASTLGSFLQRYKIALNIVTGLIVVFFGLNFIGVLKFNLFKGMKNPFATKEMGFFSAILFGIVFSIGWTPCVGAFLGSALALASQQGHILAGIVMLLCYSAGLGIPFVASAILIDKLKGAFNFIKSHYGVINTVCGILLCLVGVLMMTGLLDKVLFILS
ncbi:MAG: cytochrome c biogenesis protein CcdA [Clostridia bacterium]|nr:cytochrome c biogenesis protein CcdA [Clostridia bacterium]